MNKEKFLKELEQNLNLLPKEEIEEIMQFYKERFERASFENKTEKQILQEIESPKEIAKNFYEQFGINHNLTQENNKAKKAEHTTNSKALKIAGIISFDIFVASWLLPTLYGLMIAFYGSLATLVTAPVLFFKYSFIEASILTATFLGAGLILLIFGNVFLKLSKICTLQTINLHKLAFSNKPLKLKKNIKQKSFKKWTYKNLFFFALSFALIISSSVGLLTIDSQLINSFQGIHKYETIYTPQDMNAEITDEYSIALNMKDANVTINVVEGNFFSIKYYYDNYEELTYTINTDSNTINISQTDTMKWIDYVFDFQINDKVIIEIPENLTVTSLDITITDGSLKMTPQDYTNLNTNLIQGTLINA